MPDPRVTKLAQVLVHYSLALKPGDLFNLRTHPVAQDLSLAVMEEAVKAGANVFIQNAVPGADEIFFKYASDAQLDYINPARRLLTEKADALLSIWAEDNTRALSGVNPERISRSAKAKAELDKIFLARSAKQELRWCLTVYPNNAMAQEADMSLSDYTEFVYNACMINDPDPVAFWKAEGEKQKTLVDWLRGKDKVVLKGSFIDLRLSIKDRVFIPCDGKLNFPDGEIFTGPVEDSVEGWVRFRYPAIEYGQEVTDIELWFEKGRVVKETATKNQELLTSQLPTRARAFWVSSGLAQITGSPNSPKTCFLMKNWAARSTWPSVRGIPRAAQRTKAASTGICSATCTTLRSWWMAISFIKTANPQFRNPYNFHFTS
jgi:aminopeptidase